MFKAIALATTSMVALSIPQAVLAQQNPAPVEEQAATGRVNSGDILVTATRIATNVQDVPIAITAVSADTLQDRQITEFASLGDIVPNATFRKSQGIYGAGVSVTLRGIGAVDTQFSTEPAVSYYIDDVYYPFLFGSNFDLLDLERVEILRGPQGTLFGRNSISGAVNLVSRKPQFDDISAYVDLTAGVRNRLELRAGLNIPLADNLAASFSMVSKKQTGYMDILDFSCEMYRRGTPELAGTFPFQTEATVYAAGREPDSCVIDHLGGEDMRAARGALRWQPIDGVELNVSADYTRSNNESAAEKVFETEYQQTYGRLRDLDQFGAAYGEYNGQFNEARANRNFITAFDRFSIPGTPFRWDERFETGDAYTTYDNFCDPFPIGTSIPGNTYYNGSLFRGGNGCDKRTVPLETWGVSGNLKWEIDDHLEVTAIAGYREMETEFGAAWDGTPLADSIIFHRDLTWNWNAELRLVGTYDAFEFNSGLFYYEGYADENGRPMNMRLGTQQYQNVYYFPEAKAAYLNVTFRPYEAFGFMEGLSFSGGIRRSEDRKDVDYSALQDNSVPGSTTFTPSGTSTLFQLAIANSRWDWKLGADYKVNDDILVYASASTGYRLPGFATRVFQVGQIEQQFPTSLVNYELGFKADFFDNRLRLNGAAFWIEYSQRNGVFGGQEARFGPDGRTILAGTTLANTLTLIPDGPDETDFSADFSNCRPYNAATDGAPNGSTVGIQCITRQWNYAISGGDPVRGLELEATLEPIDGLNFNYSFGYTDRGATTGRPIGFPDFTMSGGVQYFIDVPVLDGSITPRLDWFWISEVAWSTDYDHFDDPARSTFNARVTYQNDEHEYEVALGITNLLDKEYYLNKTIFIQGLGAPANIGQPSAPREWYVSLSKRF